MPRERSGCKTLSLMHVLGKKWSIPIIEAFYSNGRKMQFNAMHLLLSGITSKNLSACLNDLCDSEIIEKVQRSENGTVHTEYVLTKKGVVLRGFVMDMKRLGMQIYGVDASCTSSRCAYCYESKS